MTALWAQARARPALELLGSAVEAEERPAVLAEAGPAAAAVPWAELPGRPEGPEGPLPLPSLLQQAKPEGTPEETREELTMGTVPAKLEALRDKLRYLEKAVSYNQLDLDDIESDATGMLHTLSHTRTQSNELTTLLNVAKQKAGELANYEDAQRVALSAARQEARTLETRDASASSALERTQEQLRTIDERVDGTQQRVSECVSMLQRRSGTLFSWATATNAAINKNTDVLHDVVSTMQRASSKADSIVSDLVKLDREYSTIVGKEARYAEEEKAAK